ncbi:MAG: nucleoside deaminase [Bacteroidales bacterium]|jgi:tRNA(adenine34) deaminase|nr:nucleoside deaminase [Bacteroidales bacterium]
MEDSKYIQLALAQARMALDKDEVPIGAIIVCKGQIIARAYNLSQTLCDPTAHAEMQAITIACEYLGGRYLNDCTIYVTVEPCPMCAAALAWAQIGRVVWGADDPKRGLSLYNPSLLHPKTLVEKGVLATECGEIVSDFFKRKR